MFEGIRVCWSVFTGLIVTSGGAALKHKVPTVAGFQAFQMCDT